MLKKSVKLKESATYEEQIAVLRKRGCIIEDENLCQEILSQISYYRLSAYFLTYKTIDDKYASDTNFNSIYQIYEFDRKLRHLLLLVLEEIEIFLRAQFSYYYTQKYGPDGYMNATNYNKKHNHFEFTSRIKSIIKENSKLPFVKHHIEHYGGKFPLWVITELFTFGMLSYFYADMLIADQKKIANTVFRTPLPKNIRSWLRCCTILRNVCAHSGRLYNTIFSAIPADIPNIDQYQERRLFMIIMAVREIYPDINKWNDEFVPEISALFEEYKDIIQLKHIGFPANWEKTLMNLSATKTFFCTRTYNTAHQSPGYNNHRRHNPRSRCACGKTRQSRTKRCCYALQSRPRRRGRV